MVEANQGGLRTKKKGSVATHNQHSVNMGSDGALMTPKSDITISIPRNDNKTELNTKLNTLEKSSPSKQMISAKIRQTEEQLQAEKLKQE